VSPGSPDSLKRVPNPKQTIDALKNALAPFADPTRLPHVAAVSLVSALLAYPNPAAQSTAGRLGLRAGAAALSGFVVWTALRDLQSDFFRRPLRAGFTAAGVGAALALAEASDAVDARLHQSLVRRGVKRPRLVLAAASAVFVALSYISPRKDDTAEVKAEEFPDADTVPVPSEVRALVNTLLSATDDWGAPQLRAQLEVAEAIAYSGEDEEAFYPGVGFSVPDGLPRAVPGSGNFPIIGRYHPFDGRSADVYLSTQNGRIDALSIGPGDDWSPEDEIEWMDAGGSVQDLPGWPAPDELTLMVETPDGLRSLSSAEPE
jgi:hypothetical protein